MSIWDEVAAEFACSHEHQELRVSYASNGARQYRMQCQRCGWLSEFLKKTDYRVLACPTLPPEVDAGLRGAWDAAIRDEVARRQAREREIQSAEWWAGYNEYLQSPEWRRRRQLVLERDGYLCQSCLKNHGSQVHHLTYDHVGDEPLFELVTVCDACHRRLTQMDRERHAAPWMEPNVVTYESARDVEVEASNG